MTLSRFLRDLSHPARRHRGGRWRKQRNLMITMVLGGLWPRAAGGFPVGRATTAPGGLVIERFCAVGV